ncbi:MAG TPA: XrtA/PEP-CTERM system-associated ATPase [Candidatus Eisenbacteria bacterium]|nr:XrtA/PEP-CTERM system-associated ATPase [Candidatus Eisenbacteria bacterium]
MYEGFYSLQQKPFAITSNPSFLYLSQRHKEALSHLTYGIRERVGFIEITGEVGTGKTTICRALLNQFDDRTKSAFIFNSNLTELQLMQTIVEDLGIRTDKKGKGGLFSELNRFLIEQLSQHNNVVLIIDEAQNLSNKMLEQVRMLSNLEAGNHKLLQIVLVGQPELRDKLKLPSLRQLRQRIAVRCHIEALSYEDVTLYIAHRLKLAGANGSGPAFDNEAFQEIFKYSGGIPRLINMLCDKALLTGYVLEKRSIDGDIIRQCIREIEGGPSDHEHHQ